jgi:hypothetical protein
MAALLCHLLAAGVASGASIGAGAGVVVGAGVADGAGVAGGGVVCVVVSLVEVGAGALVVDISDGVVPTCIQIIPATTNRAINTNQGVIEPVFLVGSV